MQKLTISAILFLSFATVSAQRIETDIFGNLEYESRDGKYTATLEKDIFNNLIFTDNRKNKITLEKKYLQNEYPGVLQNKDRQTSVFRNLIREIEGKVNIRLLTKSTYLTSSSSRITAAIG